jgi:hypothetical protein
MKLLICQRVLFFLGCFVLSGISVAYSATSLDDYPRICNLNIGAPTIYDRPDVISNLSKADMVLMGFYRTWESDNKRPLGAMRSTIKKIKLINPNILVGQYTILNEAPPITDKGPDSDKSAKIEKMDWWVRGISGDKMQWTNKYGKYDVNITEYATADVNGKHYPEWLVERDYKSYFSKVPEFDIWYLDNVFELPGIPLAKWDQQNLTSAWNIQTAYRKGHLAEWNAIRALNPNILLIGNVGNFALATQEYSGQLNGVVLEALMGLSWSIETSKGWPAMMQRYHEAFNLIIDPKLVVFNVHGKINDYQAMRFGLASALMNNGLFSYSVINDSYRSIPWFDEFNVSLGKPLQGPQINANADGSFSREFANGMVYVNPTSKAIVVKPSVALTRITGKQAPSVNNGKAVGSEFTLPARDGIILLKVKKTASKTIRKP